MSKEKKKNVKGVLVNLELAVAETFYNLAKSGNFFNKKSPTAVARELILQFVEQNQQVTPQVATVTSVDDASTVANLAN